MLIGDIDKNIKNIIREIEANSDFSIIEMETDIDHIHLMIQYIPRLSISSIVNRIKSITTKKIWKLHKEYLKKHFWKEKTFSHRECKHKVCSIGEASPETIQNYIRNQG